MSFGTGSAPTGNDITQDVQDSEGKGHDMGRGRGRGRGRDGAGVYEMVGMK